MAYCTNCGTFVKDGAKFCGICGTKIEPVQQKVSTDIHSNSTRKIKYEGELHKCPNCGAVLKSFNDKCPECGYELRGTSGVESVSDFARCYANAKSNDQKVSLIRTFVIPNTKEDILEFAILASSNIDEESYTRDSVIVSGGMSQQDVTEAWMAKFEQAYQKAQLILAGTSELDNLEKVFMQKKEGLVTSKKRGSLKNKSKYFIAAGLAVLSFLMIMTGSFAGSASGDPDSPFYMLAMLGFFPGLAMVIVLLSGKK